jgi:hypothetical protein
LYYIAAIVRPDFGFFSYFCRSNKKAPNSSRAEVFGMSFYKGPPSRKKRFATKRLRAIER